MKKVSVMTLCTMSETELNKMTKADLIASIKTDSYMPGHYKSEAEKMRKAAEENSTNERAACVMLAALVGVEMNRDEYSGAIDSKQLNILELVGLAAAKMAAK